MTAMRLKPTCSSQLDSTIKVRFIYQAAHVAILETTVLDLNPLRAKFFSGTTNIYLHFVSFLHIDTTQVVEILLQIRQELTYST